MARFQSRMAFGDGVGYRIPPVSEPALFSRLRASARLPASVSLAATSGDHPHIVTLTQETIPFDRPDQVLGRHIIVHEPSGNNSFTVLDIDLLHLDAAHDYVESQLRILGHADAAISDRSLSSMHLSTAGYSAEAKRAPEDRREALLGISEAFKFYHDRARPPVSQNRLGILLQDRQTGNPGHPVSVLGKTSRSFRKKLEYAVKLRISLLEDYKNQIEGIMSLRAKSAD